MTNTTKINSLLCPQPYLQKFGLIVLIVTINMIVPLSIDLYLPALPTMTSYFETSSVLVNLTLVGFFFFYAVGILFGGPLSDKYGRKPLLLAGVVLYIVFSGVCALSLTIEQLILARILQAIGGGIMGAVSTALVKDSFDGAIRSKVLAVVQGMAVLGPMLAPICGAFILQFHTWRATFWVLVVLGILCLGASLLFQETLPQEKRNTGGVMHTLGRLVVVGSNKSFLFYLLISSLLVAPFMGYIAICSYIYIDQFQLSQQMYSYFFAFNSACAMLGPILYIKTSETLAAKKANYIIFFTSCISGVLMLCFGNISPWAFMFCFLPFTIVNSALRPLSTNILLDQQQEDTGSAAALINCCQTVVGSLGMILGGLPWSNFIVGLAILMIGFSTLGLIFWIILLKSPVQIIGISKTSEKHLQTVRQ